MKRKAKLRRERRREEKIRKMERHLRHRGAIGEVELTPVYRRDMDPYNAEQFGYRAVYFNDWCLAQIGATWDDIWTEMYSQGYRFEAIEAYGRRLVREFRFWAFSHGIQPRGMRLWKQAEY